MKLARKLMLALAAAMLVVFAGRGILRIRYESRIIEADFRERQRLVVLALRSPLLRLWGAVGPDAAYAALREAEAQLGSFRLRWVSLDPAAPADQRPETALTLASFAQGPTVAVTDRPSQRLLSYALLGGSPPEALELSDSLAGPRRELHERLLEVLANTAIAAISSMVVVSGLGFVLVGRPLRRLAEKARRIGAGDLSGPLAIAQRDEIGELAGEMNQMCERLAAAHRRAEEEEAARLAAQEQLRHAERLSTIGTLASGVGHELGTPLNVVAGRAKMIATGEIAGPEALESARTIVEQSERMTRIIRQLLDFARRRGPQKAPCNVRDIVRHAVALLQPHARKRHVTFAFGNDDADVVASVDAAQVQQVLTNLMLNGIQAMTAGGVLTVAVEREHVKPPADHGGPKGTFVALHVIDEGGGVPEDVRPHVFEPFFTTKAVGEGTGLGLSVAYGIVREHGGWIGIDSTPGKGSRFSVFLPLESKVSAA